MYKEALRQTWVEIDLSALEHNIKEIKNAAGGAELICVVKANAYGHGSVRCAEVMAENGIRKFAVATVEEAIELRDNGIDGEIIILGIAPDICEDMCVQYDLTPVVSTYKSAKAMSEAAAAQGSALRCLIAVDTGMGRIGYEAASETESAAAASEIALISELPGLKIAGIISHFSTSDEPDQTYTEQQLACFDAFVNSLIARGIDFPLITIANSAAIIRYPKSHYNAVRPGIILYGCYPSKCTETGKLSLLPVMSVKANIVHIKTVPAGAAISYGRRFVAERESKIATVAIGYADGYPRILTGKAEALLHGKRVKVIGSICMDQCMLDVTDIPNAARCDEVIIMGAANPDGTGDAITAEELAEKAGTINYEILCDFGMRLPKIYKESR